MLGAFYFIVLPTQEGGGAEVKWQDLMEKTHLSCHITSVRTVPARRSNETL